MEEENDNQNLVESATFSGGLDKEFERQLPTVNDELFVDDSQRLLENMKRASWKLFKYNPWTWKAGVALDTVLKPNERGDLEFTKPQYRKLLPLAGSMAMEWYSNFIDEVQSLDLETFQKEKVNLADHNEKVNLLSKNSSGKIVQTEGGTLYRAGDIVTDTFYSSNEPTASDGLAWKTNYINEFLTEYEQEETINKALALEPTVSRSNAKSNLNLYGTSPDIFEEFPTLKDAMNLENKRGGRFVKVDNKYWTVFTRDGKQQVLPYNKWYQKHVNPFMVPKELLKKLKKFEGGQQGDLLKVSEKNPLGGPTIKVPFGTKGEFREVVAPTKFSQGTVDEFNEWYKRVFRLQKADQQFNRQLSKKLEELGNIQARNPGKKIFDTDLSHLKARSEGGSGLTFQEAWLLNQQRGADDILDDKVLAAAGIPKNWEELFYYWYAQKKPGKELQTAIGPLSQINVDDYFALSKGEPLNVVGKRRNDIRHLVERQIGDKNTYRYPGKRGTIQDDFAAAIKASKAGQVGGNIIFNEKLLDLRYVAENFDGLVEIGDI